MIEPKTKSVAKLVRMWRYYTVGMNHRSMYWLIATIYGLACFFGMNPFFYGILATSYAVLAKTK